MWRIASHLRDAVTSQNNNNNNARNSLDFELSCELMLAGHKIRGLVGTDKGLDVFMSVEGQPYVRAFVLDEVVVEKEEEEEEEEEKSSTHAAPSSAVAESSVLAAPEATTAATRQEAEEEVLVSAESSAPEATATHEGAAAAAASAASAASAAAPAAPAAPVSESTSSLSAASAGAASASTAAAAELLDAWTRQCEIAVDDTVFAEGIGEAGVTLDAWVALQHVFAWSADAKLSERLVASWSRPPREDKKDNDDDDDDDDL